MTADALRRQLEKERFDLKSWDGEPVFERKEGRGHWVPWEVLAEVLAAVQGEAQEQSEDSEVVNVVTEAMREADRIFEKVGGSTRHHVRDCLLPILNRNGWIVVRDLVSEVVCECGHAVSAHGSVKPRRCITRGCGCKKNQADVLRLDDERRKAVQP